MTHVQRKFNLFIPGASLHPIIENLQPPAVADAVEELKGGGLLAPYDVPLGFAKMEASFKVNAREKLIMKQIGLAPGSTIPMTARSANVDELDGSQENEVIEFTGRISASAPSFEANSVPKDEYKIGSIMFYKHMIDGEVIHHVDIRNFIGIVGGVDVWGPIRSGIGL